MNFTRAFDSWTAALITLLSLILATGPAGAYEWFSDFGGDASKCGQCHGDFRDNNYISNTDGMNWGDLHDLHRNVMLSEDCEACHRGGEFPVYLDDSDGGTGLTPIGCMGCHGRTEDNAPANPEFPNGLGAGLRQQHFVAGETVCLDCHLDSDPANYTPVGENVLPDYYANPGTGHPNMPTESCNGDGSENFAGASDGLDNDGDSLYDQSDADCVTGTGVDEGLPRGESVLRLSLAPNPMSGNDLEVVFSLTSSSDATIDVHDTAGRLVRREDLVALPPGTHRVRFDGRDRRGEPWPSGVYFVRVRTARASEVGRVVLIR